MRQMGALAAQLARKRRQSINVSTRASASATLALLALLVGIVPATARPQQSALIIDANTGATISAHAADEPRYPASLTKMMTLYVVFDLIEQGRLTYQTRIPISDTAASQQPSKLGLEVGTDIALIDAVKALVTKSANDVAVALAEKIAGSEDKFAAVMTQKARAIGMKNSTFKNASGLPNDQQVTTARDMVTLALHLHDDFPKHYPLFATRDFKYAGKTHANHNTLLGRYEGTEGIKTGYTSASGFNLVSSVKRGQKHVVGAVFGGNSAASRNQTMRTLLNIGLLKGSTQKTRQPTSAHAVAAAKPRQAPEPKIAERPRRPTPSVVAQAMPPQAMQPIANDVTPMATATSVGQASAAQAPVSSKIEPSKIEIAKVRPVLVAPRAPRQAPMPQETAPAPIAPTSPTTVAASAHPAPAPRHEPQAAPPATFTLPPLASAAAPPEPSAKLPARAPVAVAAQQATRTPQQPATRSAARSQQPPSQPAPSQQVASNGPAPIRGTPPGTLGQQAAALSGAAPAPSPGRMAAGGPPPSTVPTGANYQIQVGAFASAAEAERQLHAIRARAGEVVGNASNQTMQAETGGKQIWRARFGGFDTTSATQACTELRRRQIDCLVTRAQ